MKLFIIYLFPVCLLFTACNNPSRPDKKPDTAVVKSKTAENISGPKWLDKPRVPIVINTLLSHKYGSFRCDSAVIVNYTGVFGERVYMPLNTKGQWISNITKKKKLTLIQLKAFNAIIGSPASFRAPINMGCVNPNIGVVYFKDGNVIAQSAMSLECARVRSTAQLGSGDHLNLVNKKTLKRLEKFYKGLKM